MTNTNIHSENYKYFTSILSKLADNFYERPIDEKYQASKDVTITLTPVNIKAGDMKSGMWDWRETVTYEMDLTIRRADVTPLDMLLLIEAVKRELIMSNLNKFIGDEITAERQDSDEKNYLHYTLTFTLTTQLRYPCV